MSLICGLFILSHAIAVPPNQGVSVGQTAPSTATYTVGWCGNATGFIWGLEEIILIDYGHAAYLPIVQISL